LINTSYGPDPYPERGIHDIQLFLLAAEPDGAILARETDICLNPLQYVTGSVHAGNLPTTAGLLAVEGKTAVFSGISMKNGKLALRVYETEGNPCPVTVTTHTAPKDAQLTTLFGMPLDTPVSVDKTSVSFTLAPYSSTQVEIS
jgi:alpha-mannosidase